MSAYVTFLILTSILFWPVGFIVALIVKLTNIKQIYRKMVSSNNISVEEESELETIKRNYNEKKRNRTQAIIIAVFTITISVILSVILVCDIYL